MYVPDPQPSRQDGGVAGQSSYVERAPTPALAAFASAVWIQQVGDRPVEQRHAPHGGAEVRCVLGEAPRLLGPLTTAAYQEIPAGGTVVGVRLRPGVLGGLVGMSADELVDQDIAGTDIWRDMAHLTDLLGEAVTPRAALAQLQSFVAQSADELDPLVNEAVRNLMPWHSSGTAALPALLSISERQLRRRCRAAVGVGPKELHRILRLQGFIARVQASIAQQSASAIDLTRWAVEAGYHDQAHLSRECRRLLGVTPGEFLAQSSAACTCGHDHAASYVPMLRPWDGRFVQERRPILA
ncbi:AraC family transcriptional regulator [Pseudonocardia sp. K10HN5]|uniref:AraC family transcriptional regulator n=2 Tax=Pseudonocardia acidicola TaxID=2724939 RepID=A0ABX1SKZ6_9PSEU|nr:AraC family transcriptional regulator [Pseudonocardia acidicola]NMI02222.1 AraC family transcriptional regulator [Pseudonocardia acidicola]